jgi:probable HAF family extracellular repeat protein
MPSMSKLQVTIVRLFVYLVVMVIIGPSTTKAGYIYTTIRNANDNTLAYGINNDGQIVGQNSNSSAINAYVYNGGVFTNLDVPFAGNYGPTANGINNSGQIVGFYSDPTGGHVFVKSGGSYTTLDVPGADFTYANGINDAGDVAGYYYRTYDVGGVPTTGQSGFVKSAGGYRTIDVPGARFTAAYGINNLGQVAGTFVDATGYHGFIESNGVFTVLDHYPSGTIVYGINNLGGVVGYYDGGAGYHGFVRSSDGVYTTIQVPDGYRDSFTQAWGINDLGQIVGYYSPASNPNAVYGFLATPDIAAVPEPSMSVVMSTLLGLGYVWRRRLKTRHGVTASEQDNSV